MKSGNPRPFNDQVVHDSQKIPGKITSFVQNAKTKYELRREKEYEKKENNNWNAVHDDGSF